MITIKGVELTPEQVRKAMECDMEDIDLTSEQMKTVAGGRGGRDRPKPKTNELGGGSSGC